jgi:hypothetical protein
MLPHLKNALVENIDPMRHYMLLYQVGLGSWELRAQECEAASDHWEGFSNSFFPGSSNFDRSYQAQHIAGVDATHAIVLVSATAFQCTPPRHLRPIVGWFSGKREIRPRAVYC